jgi:UDP-N-acetylmuramate: L-alanyl-gamma-D-glutamyl-meso-diaminopimelate ligase
VHYRPRTLVINNLEFDHGDIFDDLSDIQKQFHHLVRMIPSSGLIIAPSSDQAVNDMLTMGCWSHTEFKQSEEHPDKAWQVDKLDAQGGEFIVKFDGITQGTVKWDLIGDFNIDNAVMAIAAARHAGVPSAIAIEALSKFINTKRRFELRGVVNDISVYDDFAHHPTAIAKTLAGVRNKVKQQAKNSRVLAVLEPRSNTMKSGIHKDSLPKAFVDADMVFVYLDDEVTWSADDMASHCKPPCVVASSINTLVDNICQQTIPGDIIVVMSNGGFGDIHNKLLKSLSDLNLSE